MTRVRALGARPPGLTRHTTVAALGLSCVVGLLALGGGAAGASTPTITVYSGQHQQTTQSLITAFEKKTGVNVTVRYNDEDTFADEIQAEKSHPVADVFYTENSPRSSTSSRRVCSPGSIPRHWPRRRACTTRPRATGSGSRPG